MFVHEYFVIFAPRKFTPAVATRAVQSIDNIDFAFMTCDIIPLVRYLIAYR